MTDPWAFQRWAFDTTTGSYARKAVLVALAVMADSNTGRCEAKQETLAQQTELSSRGVRKALKDLEDNGVIVRRHQYRADGKRRGDEFLLLAPWIDAWPDGLVARNDASSATGTSQQSLPAPDDPARTTASKNGHSDSLRSSVQSARELALTLNEIGNAVLTAVADVAEAKRAKPFDPQKVADVSRQWTDRDHAAEAEAFRWYWLEGRGENRKVRDIVATWRNWISTAPSKAARNRAVRRSGRQDEERAERLRKDLEAVERVMRGEDQ